MNIYRFDFYDKAGDLQYILSGKAESVYLASSYTKTVNGPGLVTINLPGDADLLLGIEDKWQVEVWRKPDGQNWAREMIGLYRKLDWRFTDQSRATLTCPGLMEMLRWRIIDYPEDTANKTAFAGVKAETIANTLVKFNATDAATTANGRGRNGATGYPFSELSIEENGSAGNTIDWYCARANLLDTLQDVAEIGGGDFDLVKTSATTWQWRWYEGQLGTDRTGSVIFAMKRGNMANPSYTEDRTQSATVAIVGGKTTDDARDIERVTGTGYAVDNDIETFVTGISVKGDIEADVTAALKDRGRQELEDRKDKTSFQFEVLQTENTRYGVDYFLGDLVTAVNPITGDNITMKIKTVSVSMDATGDEQINVDMEQNG